MYVCLCNGVTDREIRGRSLEANCSVGKLCKSLGVTPKCGKCVGMMRQILSECSVSLDKAS
jgi:bacterioferritin-associated ferredoxin